MLRLSRRLLFNQDLEQNRRHQAVRQSTPTLISAEMSEVEYQTDSEDRAEGDVETIVSDTMSRVNGENNNHNNVNNEIHDDNNHDLPYQDEHPILNFVNGLHHNINMNHGLRNNNRQNVNQNRNIPQRNMDEEEQDIFRLANAKDGEIMAYAIPTMSHLHTGIRRPEIDATHFSLKPLMFTMLQANGQFAGMSSEDPHSHLKSFMEITDSFLIPHVSDDALRLKLFPFSLRDRARAWYNSLQPDSVTTWHEMAAKFLKKYFPPTRNAKSRNEICTFKQLDDEAVPDAWERYKELLRKCPHHGIPYCIQLETFYGGLNATAKQMLDATAGGAFTACTYNQGIEILEKISNNNCQWSDPRALPPKKMVGTTSADAISSLSTQLSELISSLGSKPQVNVVATAGNPNVQTVACVYCGEGHSFENCPANPEQVNSLHNMGGFSNPHNNVWRNHPSMSWHSPALNPPMVVPQERPSFPPQRQQNFHSPNHQGNNNHQGNFNPNRNRHNADSSNSLESLMKGFMTQTQASIKSLETQLGQMALEIKKRPVGTLPSDTEIPQREGKEHVKAITLRSGKNLSGIPSKAEPAKAQPTLGPVIPSKEPSSDYLGTNVTLEIEDITDVPNSSEPTLVTQEKSPVFQTQPAGITVDLSHSGASPSLTPGT